MQVEHVARIGFATGRAAQQQGDFAVRPSLFGEIVVDDEGVFAVIAEVLAHGAAGIGRNVQHRCRVGGAGGHHDGVLHGAVFFERADDVGDGGHLLADGYVDALDARAFLIDDGVHGDGGFADLPVADDELALAAADRHHRVDALDAHLHGLVDGLPGDHAGSDLFHGRGEGGLDRALAVDGVAERIYHAAEQFAAYRHFEDALRAAGGHAFGEALVVAEHHAADGIALQVQRHANKTAGELDHLAVPGPGEAMDAHDAVRDGDHRAFVGGLRGDIEVLDAATDDVADFRRVELLHLFPLKT